MQVRRSELQRGGEQGFEGPFAGRQSRTDLFSPRHGSAQGNQRQKYEWSRVYHGMLWSGVTGSASERMLVVEYAGQIAEYAENASREKKRRGCNSMLMGWKSRRVPGSTSNQKKPG